MDIIFDFDGTISNSIIGIQDSFDKAFLQVFKENNTVDLYSMIGPPIHLILLKVRPETTNEESNLFVQLFRNNYDEQGHAMRIEEVAGGYQLLSRPQFAKWLRRLACVPGEIRLSQPLLETLALVAYRQPVLRADIEAIRGVGCTEMLRQLL